MNNNVGSHQSRIGQQAGTYAVLVAFVEDFLFHIAFRCFHPVDMQLLACLVFKRSRTHQFTDPGIHIQVQIQLGYLTHIALDINCRFFRIDAAGQIFGQDRFHAVTDIIGMRMCSQRVPICNEEKAIILILHLQKSFYCSEVIPQMQITGWADATYYCFHFLSKSICLFKWGKDSNYFPEL